MAVACERHSGFVQSSRVFGVFSVSSSADLGDKAKKTQSCPVV